MKRKANRYGPRSARVVLQHVMDHSRYTASNSDQAITLGFVQSIVSCRVLAGLIAPIEEVQLCVFTYLRYQRQRCDLHLQPARLNSAPYSPIPARSLHASHAFAKVWP